MVMKIEKRVELITDYINEIQEGLNIISREVEKLGLQARMEGK